MRISVIDLGTNSIRLLTFEAARAGVRPKLVHKLKFRIELGEGVFSTGKISNSATERAIRACLEFKKLLPALAPDSFRPIATCAVRTAKNKKFFLKKVQAKTGIKFEVISGKREAELIASGIIGCESRMPEGDVLLIDLGGGSTEIAFVGAGKVIKSLSLPIGSSRGQEMYLKSHPPKALEVKRLFLDTQQMLIDSAGEFPFVHCKSAIGSSGSIRALERLCTKKLKFKNLNPESLQHFVFKLRELPLPEIKTFLGVAFENRAVNMLAAAVIVGAVSDFFEIKKIKSTRAALSEGVFLESFERKKKTR